MTSEDAALAIHEKADALTGRIEKFEAWLGKMPGRVATEEFDKAWDKRVNQ